MSLEEEFWNELRLALQGVENGTGQAMAMSMCLSGHGDLWPNIALSVAADAELQKLLSRAMHVRDAEIDKFRASRKAEGLRIDPVTADIWRRYGQILDPYGIYDQPEKLQCGGWDDFARAPESDIWVWFGDLPKETREALETRDLSVNETWQMEREDDLPF
jgi:hypothetical protein